MFKKNVIKKTFIACLILTQTYNVFAQMPPSMMSGGMMPQGAMPRQQNSISSMNQMLMQQNKQKEELTNEILEKIKQTEPLTIGEAFDLEGKITRYRLEEILKKEKGETQNKLIKEKMEALENLLKSPSNNLPMITSIRGLENDLTAFLNYQGQIYTVKKNENIINWKVISIHKDYVVLKDLKKSTQHKIYFGQQNSILQLNSKNLLTNETYIKLIEEIEQIAKENNQQMQLSNTNNLNDTVISELEVPDIIETKK